MIACLLILITNNSTYVSQFESLSVTSLIGDSFAKIYTVFVELLNSAAQTYRGAIYYGSEDRQYMGLVAKYLLTDSFNQTISEISKFNSQQSYGNKASEEVELMKFDYLLINGST